MHSNSVILYFDAVHIQCTGMYIGLTTKKISQYLFCDKKHKEINENARKCLETSIRKQLTIHKSFKIRKSEILSFKLVSYSPWIRQLTVLVYRVFQTSPEFECN